MISLSSQIVNITGNGIPASALDYNGLLSKEKLDRSDVFMFSQLNSSDPLYNTSTNIIEYSALSTNVISKLKNSEVGSISSVWYFDKLSSRLNIDTNIIETTIGGIGGNHTSNVGINIDYFNNHIKHKVTELSIQLYDDNATNRKLPSVVGQIITSSKLSTLELVRSIYGTNTSWTPIHERSIIGVGTAAADTNNILKWGQLSSNCTIGAARSSGGNTEIRLNASHIPQHEHRFKADVQKVIFDVRVSFINYKNKSDFSDYYAHIDGNWGIFGRRTRNPGTGVQGIKWTACDGWEDDWKTKPGGTMFCVSGAKSGGTHHAWKCGTIGSISAKWTFSTTLSTKDMFNVNSTYSKILLDSSIYDHDSGENITASNNKNYPTNSTKSVKPHNNMPPFITKYIWRRTA